MIEPDSLIWVTFQRAGVHYYPAALTDPALKDVSYLGHPHRHVFHFKVWLEVFHDDRDVEFILFKQELEKIYANEGVYNLNNKSCEMIARELGEYIQSKYKRWCRVSVSEDNENGATMTFTYNGEDQ